MADPYIPRWAESGPRVEPSSSDKANGFPCGGEGLREKLNWLFWDLQGRFNSIFARSVSTSDGLAGGGDLSADRTLKTDWSGLTSLSATADDDLVNVRDVSLAGGGGQRKMTLAGLRTYILSTLTDLSTRNISTDKGLSGGGNLTADRTLVTDWSANLSAIATLAGGDLLNFRDVSANQQGVANLDALAAYFVAQMGTGSLVAQATRAAAAADRTMTASFQAWILNSIAANDIAGASVNPTTYYVTLPAGKYRATFGGVAANAKQHAVRLYNRTTSTEVARGVTVNSYEGGNDSSSLSMGVASFNIASTSIFSLDHAYLGTSGVTITFGDNNPAVDRTDAFLRIDRIGN